MYKEKALYGIGDLLTEYIDGLNLSSGVVTGVRYDPLDKEYIYSILWNDMAMETEIFESIIKWRIENQIFGFYPVIKEETKK
jgi:hypothetical protein